MVPLLAVSIAQTIAFVVSFAETDGVAPGYPNP
jgi:hypothetical protein